MQKRAGKPTLLVSPDGNCLEAECCEDRDRVFVCGFNTKLVFEMGVLDTKVKLAWLLAHGVTRIPAQLWREDDLLGYVAATVANEVNKTFELELLVTNFERTVPNNCCLVCCVQITTKGVGHCVIGIETERQNTETGNVKACARANQTNGKVSSLVDPDTQRYILDEAALTEAEADILAREMRKDFAILVACAACAVTVFEVVDEKEHVAPFAGREVLERDGATLCFVDAITAQQIVVTVVQLDFCS